MSFVFFMSSCTTRTKPGADTLHWAVVQGQRQHSAQVVTSEQDKNVQLLTPDLQLLYRYDYYVHLRLQDPWRVPLLYGRLPPRAEEADKPYEKGMYGLFMLLLFRPHRTHQEILDFIFQQCEFRGTEDDAWTAVYNAYIQWRALEEAKAAETSSSVVTFSDNWWSCLIVNTMRNYDLAACRRESVADRVPSDLSKLPVGIVPSTVESNRLEEADTCCLSSTSSGESSIREDNADAASTEAKKAGRSQRHMDPVSKICGSLPEGFVLESFHEPPVPKTTQFTEAQYLHDFMLQMRKGVPTQTMLPQHAKEFE